ncbi:MAG TPA: SDR family NAD(P)-dependent oxidoreductase [Alphaproteobacteria bacterium]|nr:SDR family NAD(P)-dependent oxidoreductase [Alphaproteobacteria bacterium]
MSEAGSPVAIVTGGARGIGRSSALALAGRGYDVALVDLLLPEMRETAGAIEALGRRASVHEADVRHFELARATVERIHATWGRVDFLLNNAGAPMPKGILEISEEEFDRTIAVNLKSCFNWCKAVAPIMLAQGRGRIVSISSLSAYSGGVTSAVSKFAYAAAKAGILGMTRALAKELGPQVAVNAICPGVIVTELTKSLVEPRAGELVKGIALGRLGGPEDVAQLVAYLATAEPSFMSGQALILDGFQWVA